MLAGCQSGSKPDLQSSAESSYKSYKVRGKVVSTNTATGEVTLDHEAIPGFMEAMTMPYKLKDSNILSELHPGDMITADLLVPQRADAVSVLDHIVVVGQAKPDYKPKMAYHVPAPGDAVPDFKLRNQDGRTIHLNQFRGRELLVTFIYTRCPLPDVCPRLAANFAALQRHFHGRIGRDLVLLSVTVDPEYDTPAVLAEYAKRWGADARGWHFLTGDVAGLAAKLGEVYWSDEGSIGHNSMTSVIGRDGRLAAMVEGSEWRLDQLANLVAHELEKSR